ncbi:MAG: hypothetical protein JSV31_23055 [Desulfobacterales bacterium]|nr:MAG: hypothetical protein JSV31_23055 [Desulfobacterales bacterium]
MQMLINGGQLDDIRLLGRNTVEYMTEANDMGIMAYYGRLFKIMVMQAIVD